MYNPFSLLGKTILVTGASSGIGRATAIECSKMGAVLVLTGRNEERLQETLALLEGDGHKYIVADLSKEDQILYLVENLPLLDGCVSNAGILGVCPIRGITEDKILEMQQVNLNAPILLTKYLIKSKKLNKNASIVYTSSAAGVHRVSIGNAIYASTKSGLDAFMRTAALELATRGIRCNTVNPAMVDTESIKGIQASETRAKDIDTYPLKRYGTPQDVAFAIVFLLSDASSWITGTALKLDGGKTLF